VKNRFQAFAFQIATCAATAWFWGVVLWSALLAGVAYMVFCNNGGGSGGGGGGRRKQTRLAKQKA
jgi:hypothetical protein